MRLFGKRANPQSEMTDVPPELRPYYREQAVAAHAHRTALRLLIIFIVLIGLVGGSTWSWLYHKADIENVFGHHMATSPKPKRTTSSASQPTQGQASQSPRQGSVSTTNSTPPPSTATPNSSTSTPTSTDTTQQSQTSSSPTQAPPATAAQPATASTTIPNTGPGTTILAAVLGSMVAAMVVYHVYQRRITRS